MSFGSRFLQLCLADSLWRTEKLLLSVKVFHTPYEIGDYLASAMQAGGVVLLKGSQNGVFLEEAIKPLLEKKADQKKLVRQSSVWLKKKGSQFKTSS
jgi:hypothetical protein